MKTKIVLRVICLALTAFVLFWMFVMSGQDADDSTGTSNWVGYIVASVIKPGFGNMTQEEQAEYIASIDHYVRKAAHFTEFAALGALLLFDLHLFDVKRFLTVYIAFLSGFVVACLDELHQLFIPGRACMFTDVLIDTGGVAVGCVFAILVIFAVNAIRKRKSKKA